jgi:L,D-transpeptidase catalytic domain
MSAYSFLASRSEALCSSSLKQVRVRDARGGLRLTAAAVLLGFSCLGGASPAAALPNSKYALHQTAGAGGGRETLVAALHPSRHRASSSITAEPAKPVPPILPVGPLILLVSIGSQRVTVYDNGEPIASSPISSGRAGHLTPTGVFSVIQKDKWHHSNLYSDAPMPYMQRITWSGVALHAGILPGYPASHGCIRLPEAFAVRLWGMTRIGARVVVTRNDVAPFEIDHPGLAELVERPDPVPEAGGSVAPDLDGNAAGASRSSAPVSAVTATHVVTGSGSHDGSVASYGSLLPIRGLAAAGEAPGLRPGLDTPAPMLHANPADSPLRSGPISLFVSRKEGKLFVRKGFEPVFDIPIAIVHPEVPIGTHVFTAGRPTPGNTGVRWLAVSIGGDGRIAEPAPAKGKARAASDEKPVAPSLDALHKAAIAALDRIKVPTVALDRIVQLVGPGATLLISDQGLDRETGKGTDFIVVTR